MVVLVFSRRNSAHIISVHAAFGHSQIFSPLLNHHDWYGWTAVKFVWRLYLRPVWTIEPMILRYRRFKSPMSITCVAQYTDLSPNTPLLVTPNLLSEQGANQMLSPLHLLWGISSPWEMSKCPTWVCWEYFLRPICLFVDGIYCCTRLKICARLCTMCVLGISECLVGLVFVSKIYCSHFYVLELAWFA